MRELPRGCSAPRGAGCAAVVAVAALSACTTMPSGPSVMALPGAGKSFDAFRTDASVCQQYADEAVGNTSASQAAGESALKSGAVATALGAAAGALFGAAAGNPGAGAAIGAGSGLLIGGVAGTSAYGATATTVQSRYDMAYTQCMYAKGNQVPSSVGPSTASSYGAWSSYALPPPPPPAVLPPPPPAAAPLSPPAPLSPSHPGA